MVADPGIVEGVSAGWTVHGPKNPLHLGSDVVDVSGNQAYNTVAIIKSYVKIFFQDQLSSDGDDQTVLDHSGVLILWIPGIVAYPTIVTL